MLDCPYVNLLHVAGRLDTDTEGLLLLSNDGQFIHQTISPKREKEKEYEHIEEKKIFLTITEGKYHQVKRMLQAVGNEVIYLKRLRI